MEEMKRKVGSFAVEEPPTACVVDPDASGLAAAASVDGVDECDIVIEAFPGLLCRDLSASDAHFIDDHLETCGSCRRELDDYRRVESALDRCCNYDCDPSMLPALSIPPRAVTAWYGEIDSPIGQLFVAATGAGVCELDFASSHDRADVIRRLQLRGFHPIPNQTAITAVAKQLNEYFRGERDRFEVPLDLSGITPFTRAVLIATNDVPFGRLSTYRQIAQSIGQPKATRAVGNALGKNPIPVIVPCHRIIRSDSTIGKYTGGIHIKQRLLQLEGVGLA